MLLSYESDPESVSFYPQKSKCNSFSLGCHKQNNSLTAEVNGVPLYDLVWVACKPPAVVLHEAASLSGIHVWTGHSCCLCCQEKGWLRVLIFPVCLLFFYYRRQQRWKITGMSSQLPFVTLTKSVALPLRLQKQSSGLKQRSLQEKCLLFPGTVILFKVFPLVCLGWPVCRGIVPS